jgi:methylglutaconyl-CoA hydratase
MMSSYTTLKVEISERMATVSMNRPEVRNAFHPTMIRELTLAFRELGSRKDIAVIVLKGDGKSFCSGADLGYMKAMAAFSFDENTTDSEQLFEMFWAIRQCPVPVIARLHGHVMGGALGLAAVCDLAAAVEGTQFCFSEVRLGLAPAVISPFVLERMAAAHARRYMLTAEVFGASESLESGLVQFVGDEASVDAFVSKTVATFKFNGPEAVRATKALIRAVGETPDWAKRKSMTTQVIAERRVSEEGQEGLRGFLEKREPKWRA